MDTNFNQPSTSSNQSSSTPKIIGAIVGILVCCSCIAIAAAGVFVYRAYQNVDIPSILTPFAPPLENTVSPEPTVELERPPVESIPLDTLQTLGDTDIPENDPIELSCRLQSVCNVETTVSGKAYQVGDKEKFWVSNQDTAANHQIDATLIYITPHSYFWAENGTNVNENDVKALMDTFESKIYPTDREFFGSESTPGIDEDPHIFVIFASDLGSSVAGYFNTTDAYPPSVEEYSNAHETFMISATQDVADPYIYAVLAHEFVHMIQFASDANDDTWITEGFAEVGSFLNGYYPGGFDWAYAGNPDLQLTDWRANGDNGVHYGQSFLYLTYFLDRFGEEATKALNTNPENGLISVDDTLAQLNISDPQTGNLITADDVFMDWAVALYLHDENVGDGRYTYHNYTAAPQTTDTEVISNCPQSALSRQVSQHGIDYINVSCQGDFTLHFSGSTATKLLPTDPHSGSYAFWSNKSDVSNMTLTREFDFTNVSGPIELSYWTWYIIEEDWDYLFVEASTDGETWEILTTPSGTADNPSGNSYGWGYTGSTGDWIQERIDLSQFAGQKVQIRFEYVTDAAVNEEGFLLDDIQIDAINYQEDFESGDGGWEAAGFVRVENVLPQTYRLALITKGDTTTVTNIQLNPDQTADIPLSLNAGEEAVLVVTGTTRFTRLPAPYQIDIE